MDGWMDGMEEIRGEKDRKKCLEGGWGVEGERWRNHRERERQVERREREIAE